MATQDNSVAHSTSFFIHIAPRQMYMFNNLIVAIIML